MYNEAQRKVKCHADVTNIVLIVGLIQGIIAVAVSNINIESLVTSGVQIILLVMGINLILFIPSIVGAKHRNFKAILCVNILLGWTGIGWIIALVWSLTGSEI
jgi:hypothetical protein